LVGKELCILPHDKTRSIFIERVLFIKRDTSKFYSTKPDRRNCRLCHHVVWNCVARLCICIN